MKRTGGRATGSGTPPPPRRHRLVAPGPGRPVGVGGERAATLGRSPQGFWGWFFLVLWLFWGFFPKGTGPGHLSPGSGTRCPPSAGKMRRDGGDGGRGGYGGTSAHKPSPELPLLPTTASRSPLSSRLRERRGFPPPAGKRLTIKPLPGVYIFNFFLSRLFLFRASST